MPELTWEPLEFLECLEVVPEEEEYGTEYRYDVRRQGHLLCMTVWPFESVVAVSLFSNTSNEELIGFSQLVLGRARRKRYKGCEYLAFEDVIVAPDMFSAARLDQDRHQAGTGPTVEIRVKPEINIRFIRGH